MPTLDTVISQYIDNNNAVARQNPDSGGASALGQGNTVRLIAVCYGVQFVVTEEHPFHIYTYLQSFKVDITPIDTGVYLVTCPQQQINWILYIITDRVTFRQALMTPNIQVIYGGHARLGQGPCFNDAMGQGDFWNDGTAPENGIFRMGFPYIGIPISEILHSYYHNKPLTADQPKPDKDQTLLHPKLMKAYNDIKTMPFNKLVDDPAAMGVLGDLVDPSPDYWYVDMVSDEGKFERHFIMPCGWQETATKVYDLGSSIMLCQAFCHFGCSTQIHNFPVVRQLANWTKDGDKNLAYFTDSPTQPPAAVAIWLKNQFQYNAIEADDIWAPALEYARQQTNAQMAGETQRLYQQCFTSQIKTD